MLAYLKRFLLIFIILFVMAFFLNKIQFMLFTIPYGSVFGFDYLFQVYFNEYRHPYFANIIITVLAPNIFLFILVYKISVFLNKKYLFYVIIFFIWFLNSYFNLYVFIDEKFKSPFLFLLVFLLVIVPFILILFLPKILLLIKKSK